MLGLLINEQEQKEIEYLLKREMDELLYDFNYHQMDGQVREAITERYQILFNIFRRVANHSSCLQYTPKKNFPNVN